MISIKKVIAIGGLSFILMSTSYAQTSPFDNTPLPRAPQNSLSTSIPENVVTQAQLNQALIDLDTRLQFIIAEKTGESGSGQNFENLENDTVKVVINNRVLERREQRYILNQ